MIRKRLYREGRTVRGGYQPRLVLEVEGAVEVYRLARHLELGLDQHVRLGRSILQAMDRHEPGTVREIQGTHGPFVLRAERYRGRKRRQPQLRLGMPAEELAALEEAVR